MQQYRAGAVQVQDRPVAKEVHSSGAGKPLEQQEVAVAVHEINRYSGVAQIAQGAGHARVERIAQIVVARPVFEQVPEDIQGLGVARGTVQELEEEIGNPGARRGEMEVGDEGGKGHGDSEKDRCRWKLRRGGGLVNLSCPQSMRRHLGAQLP